MYSSIARRIPAIDRQKPATEVDRKVMNYFVPFYRKLNSHAVEGFCEKFTLGELQQLDMDIVFKEMQSAGKESSELPQLLTFMVELLAQKEVRLNLELLNKNTWKLIAEAGLKDNFKILEITLRHIPENKLKPYLNNLKNKRVEYYNGDRRRPHDFGQPLLFSLVSDSADHQWPIIVHAVDYLLQRGMDPNIVVGPGYSALWYAQKSVACCEVLFKHGSDPNIPVGFEKLPFSGVLNFGFQSPTYYGQTDYEKCLCIVQLYIANNADVYVKTSKGQTIVDEVNRCFGGHQNQDQYRRGILDLIEARMRQIRYRNAMLVLCDRHVNGAQSVFFKLPRDIMKVLTGYATLDSLPCNPRK